MEQAEENVRDLLDRRERELIHQIQLLQTELAALRNDLTPKEVELIEVRRAKAALGAVAVPSRQEDGRFPWEAEKKQHDLETLYRSLGETLRDRAPLDLKIKELLLLAFVEHFPMNGAAPADLRTQIQTSYGREIDPGSIRPNLARLREDGIVMRSIPPKWVLNPEAAKIICPTYFNGDFMRAAAALAWREDDVIVAKRIETEVKNPKQNATAYDAKAKRLLYSNPPEKE